MVHKSENQESGSVSEFPVLQTERLALREFGRSDAQAVLKIFSQQVGTKYHNVETMQSLEQAEKLVNVRASGDWACGGPSF